MFNFTQEQYIQAFNNASDNIQEVLLSEHTSDALKNSVQRHNIEEDKILSVSALVGYTLVGLAPVKNLIAILREDAGLDEETAKNLAYELREQIFAPVAKELSGMQETAERNWQESQRKEPELMHKDESVTRKVIEE